MIFVTVGSMSPFDRLVRLIDELAPRWPQEEFFAQIGTGAYEPKNMAFTRMLNARAFSDLVKSSKLVVAHAGMGSVISAMEANTPIVVTPRRQALGEVNTDHQLATSRWLKGKAGIYVAIDDQAVGDCIDLALVARRGQSPMPSTAPEPFIENLRRYLAAS